MFRMIPRDPPCRFIGEPAKTFHLVLEEKSSVNGYSHRGDLIYSSVLELILFFHFE